VLVRFNQMIMKALPASAGCLVAMAGTMVEAKDQMQTTSTIPPTRP
jgi:hypothetical protein